MSFIDFKRRILKLKMVTNKHRSYKLQLVIVAKPIKVAIIMCTQKILEKMNGGASMTKKHLV